MKRNALALMIMGLGILGFVMLETLRGVQVLSPFFVSHRLSGYVIGVDAGHGGYDPLQNGFQSRFSTGGLG